MPPLHIGTCSWKYDSWKGIVYSENVGKDYLKEYAQRYKSVEIDQWFWSLFPGSPVALPKEKTVREYAASVPEDFRFAVKIPNSITLTHYYQKGKPGPLEPNPYFLSVDLFQDFLKTLQPMKHLLGPLMFQFEYLNREKMVSQAEFITQFEAFIKECPSDYYYGIEIRNPNYLNNSYFQFLHSNNMSHVFLQGYYMPSIFPLYQSYKKFITGQTVIRLHGPDRSAIEKKAANDWSQIIEPKDNELAQLVKIILDLWQNKVDVHVYLNNHYEGSAPQSIRLLLNLFPTN
jgi:uncharacterized protein YecE (DUF72 family)